MEGMPRTDRVRAKSRRIMRIVVIVVSCWLGVAEASPTVSFGDLVATSDGRAWVVVHADSGGTARSPSDTTLQRVSADGAMIVEPVPSTAQVLRIAGWRDDSLWVLTSESVLLRTPAGEWRTIDSLPHDDHDTSRITPLSADRAVVFRDRDCFKCTDVWVVGADADTTKLAVELGPAVPDGRGGLWAVVNARRRDEGANVHTLPGGYAHFTNRWEAWTYTPDPIDGVAAMHHTDLEPKYLAANGRGGALAIDSDDVVTIDPEGNVVKRGWKVGDEHVRATTPKALVANGDGAVLVTGQDATSIHDDSVDPAPVVRWFSASGERDTARVPTTAAWRADHETGTPSPVISIGGDTLWIAVYDAIFVRVRGHWHTIDANPRPPAKFMRLYSLPIDLGYASRHGAANGASIGIRPEMIYEADRKYRRYGLGGYAEAVVADIAGSNEGLLGAGLTAAGYGSTFSGALSLGGDARFGGGSVHPQLVVSGFVGLGGYSLFETNPLATPFGFRVDVRPGTADVPRSVTLSVAIDTIGLVLIGVYIHALFSIHPH